MSRSVTTAGAFALALTLAAGSAAMAQESADSVTSANGEVSDTLIAEDGSLAVYQKHIEVLNACDWVGLMAQYPNNVELHLGGGNVTVGREAIGAVFDGFVAPFPAGLCGLTFSEVSRVEVGGTQVVNWSADGDFLAEPYLGSDAYSSNGQYLDAFVSTFGGGDGPVYTEEAQAQLDEAAAAAEGEMNEAEEEVAEEQDEVADEKAEAKDEVEDEKAEAKDEVEEAKEQVDG